MTELLDLADALWRGEAFHPFGASGVAEIDDRTLFVGSFGNAIALTTDEGLIVVDTGSPLTATSIRDAVREWSTEPVHTIVYTHGHIDHVMGADTLASDGTRVVAHENVPRRFDRYRLTAGYNAWINRRQFGIEDLEWPTDYRYPDEVYRDHLTIELGGEVFELRHGKGETDDATWLWAPERNLICCGDFFIWACPNAGNPQKSQRYPREWAVVLREMAQVEAEALLPGHGPPVIGRERVTAILNDSAALLEELVSQTLDLMNRGASLSEVMAGVQVPASLEKPYLKPIYDEPGFIVRNTWRLYGGWFDGDPSTLKPAPRVELAREICELAGGPKVVAARAAALLKEGHDGLAAHLVELAHLDAADDDEISATYAAVYEARARLEESTMAKGIFTWAARRVSG